MFKHIRAMRYFHTSNTILKEFEYLTPTVYALSTVPGTSAIGVVRITGPASQYIYKSFTRSKNPPYPRRATLRKLYKPESFKKMMLDESLILYFPKPNTYTGEDILELHLHGGTAVINSVLQALSSLHTPERPLRYAEPGEFSKRAFQNGRFDLTEVEGINSLIHAQTESQRISALNSMQGKTKALFLEWRKRVLNNIALLATIIDFGEDHDIDEIAQLFDRVEQDTLSLDKEIRAYLFKVKRSQVLLEGIKIALIGPPNAGKSSLLNLLAGDEKAIVSDIAGTTRDSIDIPLSINGYKIIVGDTAGIRESNDIIEKEGIRRAKLKAENSDITIILLPADNLAADDFFLKEAIESINNKDKVTMIIVNKDDLVDKSSKLKIVDKLSHDFGISTNCIRFISCANNEGITQLIEDLTVSFKKISSSDKEDPIIISKRAQEILEKDVLYGFEEFYKFKKTDDIVLASEGLRYSVEGIGKVTGQAIGIEEILGVVFSSFCIGK